MVANLDQGRFKFVMDLKRPVTIYLKDGENWLSTENYLAPGDSLVMNVLDGSIGFYGRCGECNALILLREEAAPAMMAERDIAEEGDFVAWNAYAQKWRQSALRMLDTFAWQTPPDPAFKSLFTANVNYGFGATLLRRSWRDPALMADSMYRMQLDGLRFDDPEALCSERYIFFLRELPYSVWRAMLYSENDSAKHAVLGDRQYEIRDSVARSLFSGEVLDAARYQIFNDRLDALESGGRDAPDFSALRASLRDEIDAGVMPFTTDAIPERIRSRLDAMADPIPAPELELKDISGKTVRLSDFRGKAVYVDFWATSCAPCVAEIGAAKALQQRFSGKDIVFLYVSLGDRIQDLKPFLSRKKFSGLHLVEPLGFSSPAAAAYNINSLPRYLLIDKAGMLVNAHAPRPSASPDEVIERLLQK